MTIGLLKSSKKKERLYLKYIKKPNAVNKQNFVKYRNKFKSLRIKAERNYYQSEFVKYQNDLRKTWRPLDQLSTPITYMGKQTLCALRVLPL